MRNSSSHPSSGFPEPEIHLGSDDDDEPVEQILVDLRLSRRASQAALTRKKKRSSNRWITQDPSDLSGLPSFLPYVERTDFITEWRSRGEEPSPPVQIYSAMEPRPRSEPKKSQPLNYLNHTFTSDPKNRSVAVARQPFLKKGEGAGRSDKQDDEGKQNAVRCPISPSLPPHGPSSPSLHSTLKPSRLYTVPDELQPARLSDLSIDTRSNVKGRSSISNRYRDVSAEVEIKAGETGPTEDNSELSPDARPPSPFVVQFGGPQKEIESSPSTTRDVNQNPAYRDSFPVVSGPASPSRRRLSRSVTGPKTFQSPQNI
ncbi:hypothetical protein PROFUN_01075 [Planoprotostelium fungivorum]|uniref:Uncharacterized protein n=1 Tax=Planoprotostelium fungivorum TaxID=1890364 RepID=A0A2P6NCA2_9EUKA|nr:hypothetical protein PROFUN_01075 [Planoprotostelium fungivorum]